MKANELKTKNKDKYSIIKLPAKKDLLKIPQITAATTNGSSVDTSILENFK
jgi:hypothetical protein